MCLGICVYCGIEHQAKCLKRLKRQKVCSWISERMHIYGGSEASGLCFVAGCKHTYAACLHDPRKV